MLSLKAAVVPLPLLAYTAPLNAHKTLIPWNSSNDLFILRSSSLPIQKKWRCWVVPNRVPLDQYPTDDSEESDASDYEDQWASYTDSEEHSPTDSTPTTTTTYATTHGHGQQNGFEELVKEVELLLEPEEKAILETNKAPVLSKISSIKWSPFHTLTVAGQIGFMDKLLEHGFDIDSVDKDGFTALHLAVLSKKESIISHLLRKGANPHVRDRVGATPLHYAAQVGAMQTVKLLIKYKVDVNVADEEGWTPLHVAIQARCRDIAKVLLVNGADKTRRNKDGKIPLDLSLCYGKDFKSYELAKLLKLVPANRDP